MRANGFVLFFVLCNGSNLATAVADDSDTTADHVAAGIADQLIEVIRAGIDRQTVVGAQLAVGTRNELIVSQQFGVIAPGTEQPVGRESLFCIGSCSKPLVSACVMTLVDDGVLSLDDPISKWLDEFRNLRDADGQPVERAPTVRELLAHRAGIYSQRRRLSPMQTRAIRDFRLTLEESVNIISRQPLIAVPGEEFLYSGAGYCVLGRVAEQASQQSIESLLQSCLCEPLNLTRTTFFPAADDENIGTGGLRIDTDVQIHPESPHLLGDDLRLPLVGGSIHSTAEEAARFAQMILAHGRFGDERILTEQSWSELSRRQYTDGSYGLGWSVEESDEGETVTLSHGGALYSFRSMLYVSLADGYYVVAHWTLSDPQSEDIRPALRALLQP